MQYSTLGLNAPKKILVVEDDRNVRELIVLLLEDRGYLASGVGDGQSALQRQAEDAFDLLLVDLQLPDMRGDAIIKKVREEHPASLTLLMSAFPEVLEYATACGAHDFFHKAGPFDPLLARVEHLLTEKKPQVS